MGPVVYLLQSATHPRRTYVGATVDLTRRVRQHNGELAGGAKRTSRIAGPWTVVCTVGGFDDFRACVKFEFAWRGVNRRVRRWDVDGRRRALSLLLARWRGADGLCVQYFVRVERVDAEQVDGEEVDAEQVDGEEVDAEQVDGEEAARDGHPTALCRTHPAPVRVDAQGL
jgi:predicted GIY-YIG superfamily endonuclease